MQNRTNIINMALQRCGAAGINLMFQDTQEAAIASAAYDHCRKIVLAQHTWSFAQKYIALAASVENPPFGYTHRFPLPGDCAQVVDIHPYMVDSNGAMLSGRMFQMPEARWEIVGRNVYSDYPLLALRYVSDDETPMPAPFADALAWRLAMEISPYLQQGPAQAANFLKLYEQALDEAKVLDDAQALPEPVPERVASGHIREQFRSHYERW